MSYSDAWQLPTRYIGRRVLLFDRIDSTNSYGMMLADDTANDGVVVLANEQSAGRGQYGRTWLSTAGKSVLMSLVLFPEGRLRRPPILTGWAAVAVCTLIERVAGLQAKIKWPNDVLVHDHKICGILIEQQMRGGKLAAVAGIGLNVAQTQLDFDQADLPQATSLAVKAQQVFDPKIVARALISILDEEYESLQADGLAKLEAEWQERLDLLGKRVLADCATEKSIGRLIALSFDKLELETPAGERLELRPEIVRRLTPL